MGSYDTKKWWGLYRVLPLKVLKIGGARTQPARQVTPPLVSIQKSKTYITNKCYFETDSEFVISYFSWISNQQKAPREFGILSLSNNQEFKQTIKKNYNLALKQENCQKIHVTKGNIYLSWLKAGNYFEENSKFREELVDFQGHPGRISYSVVEYIPLQVLEIHGFTSRRSRNPWVHRNPRNAS